MLVVLCCTTSAVQAATTLRLQVPARLPPSLQGAPERLAEALDRVGTVLHIEPASGRPRVETSSAEPLLMRLLPLPALARQIPSAAAPTLPFLYRDLDRLHSLLDGELGERIRRDAQGQGWALLAFWDDGLRVFSGNKRFDRLPNLTGTEFLLLTDDRAAERQFTAFDAWTRRVDPGDQEDFLRECLVGSREATPREILDEELFRVHLDLSRTEHRYQGWVMMAESSDWSALPPATRTQIEASIHEVTGWQRRHAAAIQSEAVATLRESGMAIHELSDEEWAAFAARSPAPAELLPTSSSADLLDWLGGLAAASAGRIPGSGPGLPTPIATQSGKDDEHAGPALVDPRGQSHSDRIGAVE